jgi:hypothetical protein
LSPELRENHDIGVANRPLEKMAKLKYFEETVTNQNLIHEKLRAD